MGVPIGGAGARGARGVADRLRAAAAARLPGAGPVGLGFDAALYDADRRDLGGVPVQADARRDDARALRQSARACAGRCSTWPSWPWRSPPRRASRCAASPEPATGDRDWRVPTRLSCRARWLFPPRACGGCARPAPCAAWCARPSCRAPARLPAVRHPRHRAPRADRVDAGDRAADDLAPPSRRPARSPRWGSRRCCCSASPPTRTRRPPAPTTPRAIVQLAVRALKQAQPDLVVITDVCLCEYTSTATAASCATTARSTTTSTLELLAKTAISHAEAGADAVAPSRHDGRARRRDPRAARRRGPHRTRRSSPTAPSSHRPSTARFARRPSRRPRSATAAATRWTRPTPARRCARR